MAATFHFVSLKCIKQQEVGADEIRILIGSKQVFPAPPEKYIKMRKGDSWVNGEAPVAQSLLEDLLLPDKAMDISGYYQVEALTEAPISATGAVIQVIEVDEPWTKNDVIGKLLVSDVPSSTVQTRSVVCSSRASNSGDSKIAQAVSGSKERSDATYSFTGKAYSLKSLSSILFFSANFAFFSSDLSI